MANWLVLQQVLHEGPGIFLNTLDESGHQVVINRLWEEPVASDANRFDVCIIMGGPMSVNDDDQYPFLRSELQIIDSCLRKEIPLLGICLGAQLIAKALGARVYKGEYPEYGWLPIELTNLAQSDSIFQNEAKKHYVFHWHGETFDMPSGAQLLASSSAYIHQAFVYGHSSYGLQFHPEMTEEMISNWIRIGRNELIQFDANLPDKILSDSHTHLSDVQKFAQRLMTRFGKLVEKK